jgi:hypothetical protein
MTLFNSHTRTWDDDRRPEIAGPIELYRPTEDGTENLPADANFEVEFEGDFETIEDAIDAIDCCGRWLFSTPDRGRYLGHLNSVRGSVEVVTY